MVYNKGKYSNCTMCVILASVTFAIGVKILSNVTESLINIQSIVYGPRIQTNITEYTNKSKYSLDLSRYFRFFVIVVFRKKKNHLHSVSRTKQGRQREPSVKTLRSSFSAGFWRHCVLSGRTQRRALPRQ